MTTDAIPAPVPPPAPELAARAERLYQERARGIHVQADHVFAGLLAVQWLAGIAAALVLTPKTGVGASSSVHVHVLTAALLGGVIAAFPVFLALRRPGDVATRHAVAIGQMLAGALLIHLTGGRIETHFHIFGSLALLSFYRDWRVLVSATAVVLLDHGVRGFVHPLSIYGSPSVEPWRWAEHGAWVVFEDVFLVWACRRNVREMREMAVRRAELELERELVEAKVVERTAAARASEARLLSALDGSATGMAFLSLDGRWLRVNEALCRLLGRTEADLLGGDLWSVVHPDERDELVETLSTTPDAAPPTRHAELRLLHADGRVISTLYRDSLLPAGPGVPACYVGHFEDVSARLEGERQLVRAKDAAVEASRVKAEFLANMSHEIRTPMNAIIGMTELALTTELTVEQREYLDTTRVSAEGLLRLLEDILDFSKLEARRLDLDVIPFELSHVLSETMRTMAPYARPKGLELVCHVHPEVPGFLEGDPVRLRQILVNLVGNAIKFTERGEVVVSVGSTPVGPGRVMLAISVADTGIGMPPEVQDRLFRPFMQADSSTTRRFGGTGLGLAIASQLVAMMQGELTVESEPGRGTTVHLHLPCEVRLDAGVPAVSHTLADLAGMAVLVVDDDATNRRILEERLRRFGMRPTVVDGGHAALAAMGEACDRDAPFPLALLDDRMPEMDGATLAARMQADPRLRATVILLLSSVGGQLAAERGRSLGIAAFLTKPVRESVLLDALLAALGRIAVHAPPRTAFPPAAPAPATLPLATPPAATPPLPTTPAAALSSETPLRVLLAEDSPVNRLLMQRLLEKRGHTVEVAVDGREAVRAVEAGGPDVVLMDVQMPHMDGIEATQAIRRAEAGTGRHLPIVAITAHAMKGDRERCLAAGMDAYLSKPVRSEELDAALAGIPRRGAPPSAGVLPPPAPPTLPAPSGSPVPERAPTPPTSPPAPTPVPAGSPSPAPAGMDAGPVFDDVAAMERLDGDRALLRTVADLLFEEAPRLLAEMRRSCGANEPKALAFAAHTLKGALRSLAAERAAGVAERIDRAARGGTVAGADAAIDELEAEVEAVRGAIDAYLERPAVAPAAAAGRSS